MGTVSRRGLLVGAVLGLAGCTSTSGSGSGSKPTAGAPSASPTTTPPSSAGPTQAVTPLWTPNPGEIEPDIKAVAVQYVADHAGAPGLQVIDAQYGGLLDTSASVLVVTTAGTFDVRLVQASPRWRVTDVHPSTPGPAAATISAAAAKVLGDSRITLPPAAVADIRSGAVHDTVLQTLLTLSQSHELAVSVVRSGHPIDVFGTTRPSDHPLGRAVDIWSIDGHPVVDPATPPSLVDGLMRQAAALGSYNVGGPRQLSGSQFFSDRTHHDHVHLGFTG